MLDLGLAVAHHILVFGLLAMTVIQRTLLGAPKPELLRLSRIDMGVGVTSGLVLAVGVARVVWGLKGWEFYQANPWFWAKLGVFFLIGAVSIRPTLRFIAWARAAKADPAFLPPAPEIAGIRRTLGLQVLLFVPLLAFAGAMARWPF